MNASATIIYVSNAFKKRCLLRLCAVTLHRPRKSKAKQCRNVRGRALLTAERPARGAVAWRRGHERHDGIIILTLCRTAPYVDVFSCYAAVYFLKQRWRPSSPQRRRNRRPVATPLVPADAAAGSVKEAPHHPRPQKSASAPTNVGAIRRYPRVHLHLEP